MRGIRTLLSRLKTSDGGVAAVEFAMILPVLAVIVISLPDVSQAVTGVIQMENAARASVQYAMGGGNDMSVAHTVGMQSWTIKPTDAVLTGSQSCKCGAAAGTCGQLCADGTNPQTYFTVVASGTLGGSNINFQKTITRSVRVQ
jgi:Flp pilus assembly protein TadG